MNKFITGSKLGYLRRLYKTNPVLALIKAGKTVLENANWTKGSEAKTASGKDLPARTYDDLDVANVNAGSFCAIGAIRRGQYELTGKVKDTKNFTQAQNILDIVSGFNDIVEFNDKSSTRKAAVIKKFDQAIKSV